MVKRIHSFSAWILIQALLLAQALPAYAAWNLRVVEQRESKGGLEELEKQLKPAGLEEPRTLPQAISRWFKVDATAKEEQALEDWLAARGEERIRRFVERVIDRLDSLADLRQFGAFEVPTFDPATLPAPGQRSGSYAIPSSTEEFERERVRMMAHISVRRAFGHLRGKPIRVVANVGIGYVGTAVTIVTADADRYVTIAYQRPSKDSSQKVNRVNEGKMPVQTADVTVPVRLKAAVERGDLTATFLIESLAVADLIMLETELHFRKYYPKRIDQGESDPEASLRLIRQVGSVMQPHATMLIESTVPPGFIEREAWPALTETLRSAQARRPGLPVLPADRQANVAYAFQRLEPGPRWLQSLMEYKRIGAALTPEAREALEEYFRSVGFKSWEIWSNPSAVAALKDLENAYRVGLIEITGGFLRGLEKLYADAWRIFAEIAADRPETHGSIQFVPAIQEGQGYCCPKELGEFIAGLKRNYGVSDLQIKQILSTRIDAIAVSDFRAEDYAYWLIGALDDAGLSLRDSSILVAGASYKPGVGDTRWTGAERLIRRLAHQGANVLATDPYVKYWPEFHGQQIRDPESWAFHLNHQEVLRGLPLATVPQLADAMGPQVHGIVLATRHWQYVGRHQLAFLRNLDPANPVHQVFRKMFEGIESLAPDEQGLDAAELSARRMGVPGGVIIDTYNFLHDNDIREFLALGWQVLGSGKGHIPLLAGEITPLNRLDAHQRLYEALQALYQARGVDEQDRRAALAATRAKMNFFQAQVRAAGIEETDLAEARASLAEATNALRHAVAAQRPVLKAQVELARVQIRHLEATARTEKEQLADRVVKAEFQLQRALSAQQQQVVETTVTDVVNPTLRVVAALLQSGGAELSALGRAGLPFLRHPASAGEAAKITEALAKLGDEVQGLRFHVDALMEALLTPEGKTRMWKEMARLRARSELAVPTPRVDLSGKVLLPDTIPVLPGTYPVGDENGALYYARRPDNRLHRVDRRPWNATDFNALTLKVIPDLAKDPAGMPQAWGRVSVTSPLYLTPVVAPPSPERPDGGDVIHGFEAYPGAFDQLPPEFRRWFLQDALGRGLAPTTMNGKPQSTVGLVMQVNLQTTTPARGRGGVWYDTTSRQPFMYTADGFEWLLDIKALGPYGGGNPVTLEYNEDRVVSGGREGAGKVAQSRLGQLIGFQQDWSEIHNLWMLRGTEAWEKGWVSRPVFILRFQFAGNPQHTLAMVARGVPTNERLGQSHIGQPDYVSNRIGWNTAEILLYPQSAVHIALTADNIMSNGYATDMGSLIWLHNERDPRGALNKYGGFSMQIPLFTFQEIKVGDFSNPRGQFLIPWIQGFRERFLESRVGRERVRNPEQFAAILDPTNPLLTQDPNGAIDLLMETLWRHYLPWHLLKERLESGYGPTRESTYSQTSGTGYLPRLQPQLIHTREGEGWAVVGPAELAQMQKRGKMTVTLRESEAQATVTEVQFKRITGRSTASVRNLPYQRAKRFIAGQRELLTIARRLIQAEGYAKLDFDFGRAFQVLARKERAIKRGLDSYADAYDLSEIYPAVKPSVIPVISNLDEMARGAQPVSTTMTRMAPSVMADKAGVEFLVAGQPTASASKSGLEERATFSLDQWQRIALDPNGSGLREAVGKLVKPHRVEGELKKVRRLVQEAVKKKMFEADRLVVLIRSPGRARIKMGHPDLPGIGAFSLDAATYQAIWMLAQLTDDGRVIADNLDPQYRKLEFDMDAEDVLPRNADAITEPRPQWYEWAMAHQFSDRWEGLVKGGLAFVRTRYLDPAKTRREALRGKGFRLLLADTDLPSGKGFSASSALPAGIGLALNALFEKESPKAVLSMKDLTQLDYAAYLSGDLAGMADISAILFGELGQATVLWYDPDRIGERVILPEDFRIFAVDSGVDRLDEPHQPDDLKNYAKYVKKLSNVAVRLAILWMRAMSRENPTELGQLESLLTENHPTGVVRELTAAGAITQKKYAGMVGGLGRPAAIGRGAREKRERFVHQVMAQIPNDWTLGQIVAKLRRNLPELRGQINAIAREVEPLGAHKVPKKAKDRAARLQRMRMETPIPMRQMSWYGIRELQRGLKYLDAAKAGDVQTMLQMMREAHNGDRALYDPRQGTLAGIPVLTSWARTGPIEAYQRSLVEIDGKVDRFEAAMKSETAARIGGAGLGGLIMVGQRAPAYNRSKRWWTSRGHQVIEVEPSAGARVIHLPNAAAALAGLEEKQYEVDGTDVRILQTIRLRASDHAEVITLPNGSTIEAKSKGAVLIEPGTLIQSGVKVVAPAGKTVTVLGEGALLQTGTVIDGEVWVGRNAKLSGYFRGDTWVDHNVVFTPGSQTVVEDSVLAGQSGKPVSVKQSTGISNSVVWESMTFQDAVVLDSIMHNALAGNHTLQSRSRLAGASAQNRASAAHFNYLISMFTLPLAVWRDLSDPAQREEAYRDLAALRNGTVVRRVPISQSTTGPHVSRPLEELTLSYNGQERVVLVRASNLGAGFGTSNFKARETDAEKISGTKGPTLFWGGVMAGVGSYSTASAEVAPNTVLSNNAGTAGQVLAPGTLIVPEAAPPGKGVKEGRMDDREGRLSAGVSENIAVRLQVLRALEILARASAEGISRAQSPAQRAGYRKEVELLAKFHAETIADLQTYLTVVKHSARNLQSDLEQSFNQSTADVLKEQKIALGIDEPMYQVTAATQEMAPYAQRIAESSAVVRQAVEAVSQSPNYRMADAVRFENPDGVFELIPGSPAMNGAVIADGQRKVNSRGVLGIIFVAGKGGRFKDSVAAKSPEYGERARELDRADTDGDVIKFAAPVGVSNFPAVLRQLEAFAELGFRSGRPFEVALVDSAGNREMLVRLLEADRRSVKPRIRWEFLNFVGAQADGTMVLVNGATLQEVDPATGKPVPGTQVRHSHVPLVDQGEGLPATYAADVTVGGVQHKKGEPVLQWNPAKGERDLPYKVPSGEYGALMAGVNAARSAGIDVARRDLLPTYGDQVELYSDPDRVAALLGNVDKADVTGVSIPHRLVNEQDPGTGRPKWDPDGGGIVKAVFPDGTEQRLIVERDTRDPARAADGIYNAKLDEQEAALAKASGVGYPYNAAPPVFSASFVGDLLNARVDIRHQRKDRQIPFGPGLDDKQLVPIQVTELEMTQLMQIASQQGRVIQVARAPREARQALKGADDLPPAYQQVGQRSQERLRRLLGDRLKGEPAYVEIAPSARSFFVTGEGSLTVTGNVGIEIDRWGVWVRRYEGESAFAGLPGGIPKFSRGRRLVIPATSDGVIPLERPVVINEQTFDALALSSIPNEANPLSGAYVAERYGIPSPALSTPSVEYAMDEIDPEQVARDVKDGKRVVIRTKHDRVGHAVWDDQEKKWVGHPLWDKQENREELHYLYGLVYDIAEGRTSLDEDEVVRTVELLNHPNQAVAAAARDVIVKARVHGLSQTVQDITRQYQSQSVSFGPYAEHYFRDALTAFIDPTHKMELGSPATPVFSGAMSDARMHELHERLKLWVDPKSKLSMLTGSGQRMAAPIGLVEAGFTPRPNGKPTGFPSAELASDIGSQPHDVVKILFALVAKLFVENMPRWRQELGRTDGEKQMSDEWSVAIGMDPRSSSPAIFQVATRIFRRMGVGVKFTGITSAPEAAARALLSDPNEHLLASYEITPSHIKQGHQGTKLMLWLGQILPWAKAEEFNRLIRAAAQDFDQVKAVVEILQDPALNAEVEAIMRQMPADYADSKRRYQHYLKQSATGYFGDEPGVLEQKMRELVSDLKARGITVVLDTHGGARITDLPLFDEMVGGYVVIGANAAEFAHSLPPGEGSAISLLRFAAKTADAFQAAGLTPVFVNPDPDGDRKGVIYRDPVTGKFLYLDPQYGFMLDVVNLSMSAREASTPQAQKHVGVTSNDATTPSVQILGSEDRLDYRYWPAEVGEANVVKGLNELIVELAEKYGDRRLVAAGGGEGSAAAFIGDLVQVRDMFQAFGSMFNLYRKPEWVKQLIDLLVDNDQVKARLKNEVDTLWYQPAQLQYLLHRIVHRILPAMRNADPGYETEVHLGVGIADQKAFKDTADRLLVQDGEFVPTLQRETAVLISEVIGEPVSPEQITVSDPINNIEEHQLRGPGNRTLPDGRVIHDGGYEIQILYTASADTKNGGVAGRTYYLYKLWLRRSKTEIGVTRRLILPVAMFVAREDPETGEPKPGVDQFLDGLFQRIYPRWLAFLNELEAAELRGHLEGAFGLDRAQALAEISDSLDTLLANTPIIRKTRYEKLAIPGKDTYSATDAANIAEQDAAAEGALSALSLLLSRAKPFVARLREAQNDTAAFEAAAQELREQLVLPPKEVSAAAPSRNELASSLARDLAAKTFQWKVDRVAQSAERFARFVEDLQAFAEQGGAAYPNLVMARIILSQEQPSLTQTGIEVPAEVAAGSVVIVTPEMARAGLEALSVVRPSLSVAVIAQDEAQKKAIMAGLEDTGLVLAMPILVLEGSGQTLAEMVLGAQMTAWARGLETYVVNTFRDLLEIAPFLKFIPSAVRAWTERVQQLTTAVSA